MAKMFSENDYVWHESHGVGRVAVSDEAGVLVEFDNGHEDLFEFGPRKNPGLLKLQPAGFFLRLKNEPDILRSLADTAPHDLIATLHGDLGATLSRDALRGHISPALVAQDLWPEWWKAVAASLRQDPRFSLDKNDTVHYLGDLVQLAADLLLRFKTARSLKDKEKISREILRMEEKGLPMDEAKEAALGFFTSAAASTSNNIGARLDALIFLNEIDPPTHDMLRPGIEACIRAYDVQAAAEAMSIITDSHIRAALLQRYKELLPDSFLDIAMTLTKRYRKTQRDWILDTLLAAEDKSDILWMLNTVLHDVPTNQQPYVWFGLKMIESPDSLTALGYTADVIIRRLFKLVMDAHMTSAFSSNPKEGPSVSREEDEIVKFMLKKPQVLKHLKKHTDDVVLLFASLYGNSRAIIDEDRDEMMNLLRQEYPALDIDGAVAASAALEEDEIILTRDAFDRFEEELRDLTETQLPEVSRAIGVAREWGDLSENAEYHAAREKQGLLVSRKRYLERLLETAKIMEDVSRPSSNE